MCGIVGYTGVQGASPILLEGLKKLEYRGYDSAGIALVNNNEITISKVTGTETKDSTKLRINWEIPKTPPLYKAFGTINVLIAKEDKKIPKTT